MYFQIEITPEHIRRARRVENVPKESPKEECPRLVLAPFSRPPQVVFDNVLIGSSCERNLEVFNPSKQLQQITLGKSLPPGLVIHLPGEWLELEPETCYCLTMMWTPSQPTAMRETIRFTNEQRGRYDVIVVLKSVMNIKGKVNQSKGFKTSPGKMKKKPVSKKSPVSIYKKKAEIIYKATTRVKKTVNVLQHKAYQTYNKENVRRNEFNYSVDSYQDNCPFDSPTSLLTQDFNTSEIFPNKKKTNILQETYEKSYNITNSTLDIPPNILKGSNKQNCDVTATDIFDNLTFTPLKSLPAKTDKLDKGPRIILSVNSESDFDDSLDMKNCNKENHMHSIISITSAQPPNTWLTVNHMSNQNQFMETPTVSSKKHPNTSSPKELNSPNFSINTDFSRISDLSFFPQRFSTERKLFPKIDETHEILDDKLSSDTYTKDSPNTPMEHNRYQMNAERPPHYFNRDQPKMCRQSLFSDYQMQREAYDKHLMNKFDHNVWQNELRIDTKSPPPRSITPPLQSIPEESIQFSETHVFDKTDKQKATFIVDRTFDRPHESSISTSTKKTWSKKAVRVETDLWKVPIAHIRKSMKSKVVVKPKDSICSKISNVTFESNKSINQNITVNQIGNIYSQASTVNPFLSATYFYDEEAVHRFKNEFKRWLNCILTPPADLESNEEQKIDLGKAWIENRNKEVPLAPTKEQVSSAYHNSHRLESLRRSARALLINPEMTQVFLKLNAQIEKKLIAIRTDRNLHLDVGLQKIVMELLLSYNPLWLRIGLEAIYGLVLPLKSNSDIEGLTTFIIQRMFKNPFLKNKTSKSSAPNMLLPAYMEAIKKFTLKKFFMLVFFLDQAKQRKLISHDPCLFCRKAICKESREIILRFTRELIAGIGDITKHLRPLGYVVCHKQSYLDEYKYAVHNLALDIRDGVRLVKVMEIILMKNGLLNQLRTPAISRLQKIHNVQVAMNALKEANFVIDGEITATDIADGHREKTLSLLWQIIHVFRAPLFERAANIIQTWWRKKYEVIVEKRKVEERIRLRLTNAASVIQHWWRTIQYNRQVEWRMQQITTATIVMQKYCRMWLCRTRLRRFKTSVLKIEEWFRSVKLMREAKTTLKRLKTERELLRQKCATTIQSYVKRWLCVKQYKVTVQRIVQVQSLVRRFIIRRQYLRLMKTITFIQQKYRSKLLMRQKMQKLQLLKQIEAAVKIQNWFRNCKNGKEIKQQYEQKKQACVTVQRYYKAYIIGRKVRHEYIRTKTATIFIQRYYRSYIEMKTIRHTYIRIKTSTVKIQTFYRSHLETKKQRAAYLKMKTAVACIENTYKRYKEYQMVRENYLNIREATIKVQRRYRSIIKMRLQRSEFLRKKDAILSIQRRYRALISMRVQRQFYLQLRSVIISIQTLYRAQRLMKQERLKYVTIQKASIFIQRFYRAFKMGVTQRQAYLKLKDCTVIVQKRYRALIAMRKERSTYLRTKTAAIEIQRKLRANNLMLKNRTEYTNILKACKTIQVAFRAYVSGKKQRAEYLKLKACVVIIQTHFRMFIETRKVRNQYVQLRKSVILIQRLFRGNQSAMAMRREEAVSKIQTWYRSVQKRNTCRKEFLLFRKHVVTVQSTVKMHILRKRFLKIRTATLTIQRYYRSYKLTIYERQRYVHIRLLIITLQSYVRSLLARKRYLRLRASALTIQAAYKLKRQRVLMRAQREAAAILLQKHIRRYLNQTRYRRYREKALLLQGIWRGKLLTRLKRCEFLQKRRIIIKIQALTRGYLVRRDVQLKKEHIMKIREENRQNWAASKIQALFRGHKARVLMHDIRVVEMRQRWRAGALRSTQETLKKRNEEAMEVLMNMYDIETVIRAFRSLELLTEVFPMMYHQNAASIVRRVYVYMSVTNRSISSIEMLKSAAAILVNFARYKVTGPKIYARDRIPPILKFMWRFSNSETLLFCILSTYLWLCSKYDEIREDLTEFLQLPENHKMLVTIKGNVDRMKRMASNSRNKYYTPQPCKFISHTNNSMNISVCSTDSSTASHTRIVMPALEPDYGIIRIDKPRYFEDAQQAINCLFHTFKL